MVGEDRKKPVIDADGFIDLFVDLLASRDVVGSEPATKSVRDMMFQRREPLKTGPPW